MEIKYQLIGDTMHRLSAYNDAGDKMGVINWAARPHNGLKLGEISSVTVRMDHRRKGVATALFVAAQNAGVTAPKHSAKRSEAGEAWATKVGGSVPLRKRDKAHGF